MIYYAMACLIVAAIAALLGFSVLAGTIAWVAKAFFYIFVTTLLVSLLAYGRRQAAHQSQ